MILILGTAAGGGIDVVIKDHINSSLYSNEKVVRLRTHQGKGKISDMLMFFKSLIFFLYYVIFSKVKLVHSHMSYNGSFWRKLVFLYLSKIFRVKYVCHLHGSEFKVYYEKSSVLRKSLIRYLIVKSDEFIVLSNGWGNYIRDVSGRQPEVINNFVDVPDSFMSSDVVKCDDVVFIGALIPRKGPDVLLKAYFNSKKVGKLHICGDGPMMEGLKRDVKSSSFADSVIFHGWVSFEQKMSLLQSSKMMVLPTFNEGLPLTIIEAMATRAAVLSSPVGAIPEVIFDKDTGFLFSPGNDSELTRLLDFVWENDAKTEEVTEKALDSYKTNFTSSAVIPKLKKVYSRLGLEIIDAV